MRYPSPPRMKAAPKIVTLEIVFVLRWKICAIERFCLTPLRKLYPGRDRCAGPTCCGVVTSPERRYRMFSALHDFPHAVDLTQGRAVPYSPSLPDYRVAAVHLTMHA